MKGILTNLKVLTIGLVAVFSLTNCTSQNSLKEKEEVEIDLDLDGLTDLHVKIDEISNNYVSLDLDLVDLKIHVIIHITLCLKVLNYLKMI